MWLLPLFLLAPARDGASRAVAVAPAETLHVVIAGAGEPVVLLPGLFGSAYGFRKLEPLLTAAGYRTIVIEPLGVGASGRPERADYSLTAQANRIAAALDSLGVTGAIVVAHSLGASMAYRLAYRRPDLVRGLVSLDGGPAEAAATPGFRRAMRFAPWIKLFGGVKLVRRKIRKNLVAASGDTTWVDSAAVAAYTAGAAADLDGTLKAYLGMARAREPERLEPHLAAIRCPVRLVLGTAPHDNGIQQREVDLLGRMLSRFTIDSVGGAGHFLYEERPDAVVTSVQRLDSGLTATGPQQAGLRK
jgi:pimeloyl-ACP methyl ester carboxylesterase